MTPRRIRRDPLGMIARLPTNATGTMGTPPSIAITNGPFLKGCSVPSGHRVPSAKSLLTLEGGKVVEAPGETVLSIGPANDFDPCALLHVAYARQSDPESLLKLVGRVPGHIRR